jgi:SAM-dependent methyltransferase
MKYRISQADAQVQQDEYRKNYLPFVPLKLSNEQMLRIGQGYMNLLTTQNGEDFDDSPIPDDMADKTMKYFPELAAPSSILLSGVGAGREVLAAKVRGLNAVGLTLGSRNVEFAKRYLHLNDSEIMEAVCEVLPFQSNSFDAVAGYQILEHAMSPLLFLLEQSRVLKMGGKIVMEWPLPMKFTDGSNAHHQVCFVPGQVQGLFMKAGFEQIRLFYDDLSPIPESDMWRGDQENQDRYCCIEAVKAPCNKDYVKRHWESKT